MNKQIIFITLLACSISTFASELSEREAQEKENMKILADMELPLPGSGISLVPRASLDLPPEVILQGDREAAEFREKGYVNKYTNAPRELLRITNSFVNKEIMSLKGEKNDQSTGFSRKVDQLKLGFKFPSLSKHKMLSDSSSGIRMLGAVPQGGFHDEKGGWSGAAEFFTYPGIGTCAYGVMNVKVSNTAIQLAEEDVTYTINEKATVLLPVEGSESSGFIYSVKWYDNDNYHGLECANMKFSPEITTAVIELAKKIDKQ